MASHSLRGWLANRDASYRQDGLQTIGSRTSGTVSGLSTRTSMQDGHLSRTSYEYTSTYRTNSTR